MRHTACAKSTSAKRAVMSSPRRVPSKRLKGKKARHRQSVSLIRASLSRAISSAVRKRSRFSSWNNLHAKPHKRSWRGDEGMNPLGSVARELGISGRGLARICARFEIPVPPRGYWAKLGAGKRVSQIPLSSTESKLPSEIMLC